MDVITRDLTDASVPVNSFVNRWKPELDACFEILFYSLSTTYKASPGMKTFGFTYSKKGNPYILALLIFCKWFYSRFQRISIYQNWREAAEHSIQKKLWRLIKLLDAAIQIFSLANYLKFFSSPATSETYPDLTSRLSGYGYAPLVDVSSVSNGSWVHEATTPDSFSPDNGTSQANNTVVKGGANRAEAQNLTRHVAWQSVQSFLMALAVAYNWRSLGESTKRYVIDIYYRMVYFFRSHSEFYNYFFVEKYIPDILLRYLKSEKSEGPSSTEKPDCASCHRCPCTICGLNPAEVSL